MSLQQKLLGFFIAKRYSSHNEPPVGEVTTSSEYFASSGRSKPARSTSINTKAHSEKKTPEKVKLPSTNATPNHKAPSNLESDRKGKTSSRKKSKPNYVEIHEDEESDFDPKVIKDDADSGEDIFVADYKTGKRDAEDAYESEDDEDQVLQSSRSAGRGGKGVPSRFDDIARNEDSDIQMKNIPEYTKSKSSASASKGRKR